MTGDPGHIFVLSRGDTSGPAYAAAATQLLEFDAKGQFVREIGKNLYAWSFGHTVKVDPADNIYAAELLNWRVQKLILKP
jgi:hypothetical protein